MNTLIIGAGAVGVAIGASLSDATNNIDFLTNSETKKAINTKGIKRTGIFGDIEVSNNKVKAYSEYNELTDDYYNFIIICTKTMANIEVSKKLFNHKRILKNNGKIIIIQNGWDNEKPYVELFDDDIVFNARVSTGFVKTDLHISDITVFAAPLLIGSIKGFDGSDIQPLVDILNKNKIASEVTDKIEEALWSKMLYNTTLNPLGAILKVPYGKLIESESTVEIMSRLIEETYDVMKACGFKTFWETADEYKELFFNKLVPETAGHRSSTLQDIEKKRKTEIESLSGTIVRLGKEKGIITKTHEMLYLMVKTLEDFY